MQLSFLRAAVVAALLLAPPAFGHEPYQVDLVPCTESLCDVAGAAPFHEGRVEVDDDGDVEVHLAGGPPEARLCVKFQPAWGEMQTIGLLETNALGHAEMTVGEFEMGVYMGLFRVHEGPCEEPGAPLYVTAFGVHPHDDEPGEEYEDGYHGEDDNDGDGVPNEEDPDDDNDGIPDVDDPDDDNDGIPDGEDADPDDANPFDDEAVDEAKQAYKAERKAVKAEYKAEISALKDEMKQEVQDLREDLKDRLDDDL